VFLVHLEYNISNSQKFQLKDKYSHEMGNILQVIQSSIDLLSQKKDQNDVDSLEGRELIKTKCQEASTLIREIRDL
jgi:light-regulated signal transduction histidine kinase (bacteriophytochrome)